MWHLYADESNHSVLLHLHRPKRGEVSGSSSEESDPESPLAGGEQAGVGVKYDANTKPPFSYATLISQAIHSTLEKKITLNGIYKFITSTYPYYETQEPTGWQVRGLRFDDIDWCMDEYIAIDRYGWMENRYRWRNS